MSSNDFITDDDLGIVKQPDNESSNSFITDEDLGIKKKVVIDPGQGKGTFTELQSTEEGRKLLEGVDPIQPSKGKVDIVAKKSGTSSNDYIQKKLDSFESSMPFILPFMYPEKKVEPKSNVEELSAAPEQSIIDKMKSWWVNPKEDRAKSDNILALHKSTGLPIADVRRNYESLSRAAFPGSVPSSPVEKAKYLGSKGMEAAIVAGLVTHPVMTAVSLGTYFGIDEFENLVVSGVKDKEWNIGEGNKFIDFLHAEGLNRDSLDLLEFIIKARIAGGVGKVSSNLMANVVRSMPKVKDKINFVNNIATKVKETGKSPDDVVSEDVAEYGIDPKIIEDAKLKVDEVKRRQEDLEVERLSKSKLAEQGRNIDEVKQRVIEENEGFIPENEFIEHSIKEVSESGKEMQGETKAEVEPDIELKSEESPKLDVNFIGMQQRLRGDPLPLVNEPSGSTVVYKPEKHNILNIEDYNKASVPKEPITDVDLKTGTPEPDALSTQKSPFRDTAENTQTLRKMYEQRSKSIEGDPELITSKLINDVNRWLDGDESIPIGEVRNTLSEFATRADQLRGLFTNDANFTGWQKTVSEASKWARGADRLKIKQSKPTLYSGIDPTLLKPFFSKLKEVVENVKFGKISHGDLVRMLKGKQVTDAEIEATLGGLKDRKGTLTKEEILEEVKANGTEFEDVELTPTKGRLYETSDGRIFSTENEALRWAGERNIELGRGAVTYDEITPKGSTQYDQYVEPGAVEGSYRELFVTVPELKSGGIDIDTGEYRHQWKDGHPPYENINNPIVRIRYNEREVNGKRILFVEEMQGPSDANQKLMPEYLRKRIYDIGVKRVIAKAKEEGFDGVSWTTGDMQAERYDLSQVIDTVTAKRHTNRLYDIEGIKQGEAVIDKFDISEDKLPELIGKDLSAKIINQKTGITEEYSGLDLKVGGEGLKRLYDQQIPGLMKKYGKGEVKDVNIETKRFEGYKYEGPIKSVEDVKKLISFDQNTSIYEAAKTVSIAMDKGVPFEEAIIRGNPALAAKLGGILTDIQSKPKVQIIDVNEKTPSSFTMYSGIPLDVATKEIVKLSKHMAKYVRDFVKEFDSSEELKGFDMLHAMKQSKVDIDRAFSDQSEHLMKEVRKIYPKESQRIIDRQRSAANGKGYGELVYQQMLKEVYDGKTKDQVRLRNIYILARRLKDIYGYKNDYKLSQPGYGREHSNYTTISFDLFKELSDEVLKNIQKEVPEFAELIKGASQKELQNAAKDAESFFDWHRKIIDDLVEAGRHSIEEGEKLKAHDFRKLKSMAVEDLFDFEFSTKLGSETIRSTASGVERLGKGKPTSILDPDARISAREMAVRAYGTIANQAAKKTWAELAKEHQDSNIVKLGRFSAIDKGWKRVGEENGKGVFANPEVIKEFYPNADRLTGEQKKGLFELFTKDKTNEMFAKEFEKVPKDWVEVPYFDKGKEKKLYFNSDSAQYLVTKSKDVSHRLTMLAKTLFLAPITKSLAVGTSPAWSTLVGLPMDVIHTLWTARTWEADAKGVKLKPTFPFYETTTGKYKMIYPAYKPQYPLMLGKDMINTIHDVYTGGPLFQNLAKHGMSIPYMAMRESRYTKGVRPPGDFAKLLDLLSSHGTKMEAWVREATADRVIRNRAREQGMSYEEALKNDDIVYEAVHAARDRMDYNQGGWAVKAADQNGMLFLNAATLGSRTYWRTARDNPLDFYMKTAQTMALSAGITASAWLLYEDIMKEVPTEGNEKNINFPLFPGHISFKDKDGNTRYLYAKLRMDPGPSFFYKLADTLTRTYLHDNGYLSKSPDYAKVTNSLKQLGPVGLSLPPHAQMWVDYVTNNQWWTGRQMYTDNGGKTFNWPNSQIEGIDDPRVSQFAKDIGSVTKLSPKRLQGAASNVIPYNNEFVYMFGKVYEEMFSDVPEKARKQPLIQTIVELPGINRIIGMTVPGYDKLQKAHKVDEEVDVKDVVEREHFDNLAKQSAWYGARKESEVIKYARSFKDIDKEERMLDNLQFIKDIKNLPHRNFWLSLRHMTNEGKAKTFVKLDKESSENERTQLRKELAIVESDKGFISEDFWEAVAKVKSGK